jgi:type 1 glutamine amidotransferase
MSTGRFEKNILLAVAFTGILAAQRGPDWARFRTAVTAILDWKIAAPLDALANTFIEALEKQKALLLRHVEASSSLKVSKDIAKNLDYNLTAEELAAVKEALRVANQRLVAYEVSSIGATEAAARKLFEFAKSLNVETIISTPPEESLPLADKLATEFGINVAIPVGGKYGDPKSLLQKIEGRSAMIGASVNTADALSILEAKSIAVRIDEANKELIAKIYELGVTPSVIIAAPAIDMTYDFLEKALQPVVADRVAQIGRTTPIRGPERIRERERESIIANIRAATPTQAQAKPKKQRRLLVLDLNVAYPGHGSIPAANLAIELWGKQTGAYEAIFSNDLDNLKYPKIKEFDAVFLNNTVGQIFPDPHVREGLMRFIREGGGLGGYHGAPHASINWTEFGDMLAARAGSHRSPTEKVTVKIDDPKSPLTAAFDGQGFEFQDEFYRFTTPPYSRDKVHVLLSFDTEKTDLHQFPNCDICVRPDNDYPISWIRSVDKGRIFYTTLGHTSTVFETPRIAKFFLAGLQFILGDLDADTTPSAKQ